MRPLKLTMSAFGSYGKETVIDFTKVDRGLFLITGDTGAGKTTIFDGIAFAIYGETSGGKRDGKMMRSQFASPADETYVELTFSYRGEIYTVRRTPEYMREKKRGSGLVKAAASVELTLPDGTAFRGKTKETDKKLCEIMGIDREQFTQIAMIAQGDFLRLLHAKSEDRKKIFSTIFHTGLYRRVEEELGEKRKEQKEKIDGTGERMKAYVQSVEVPKLLEATRLPRELMVPEEAISATEEELQALREQLEEAAEKLEQIKKEERPDLAKTREILKLFMEVDQKNLEMTEAPLKDAENRYGALREKRGLAKSKNDMLDAYHQAAALVVEKMALEEMYSEQKQCLQRAERAYQVKTFAERVSLAERQLSTAIQEERNCQANFELSLEMMKEAAESGISAEKHAEFEQMLYNPEQSVMAEWMSEWKAEEKVLEAAERKAKELEKKFAQVERLEKACEKRACDLERDFTLLTLAREQYGFLQEQFLKEQAGILAKERLASGQPCPVCGSLEHPSPAVLSADAVTEVQVKKAQDEWERIRSDCETRSLELREERTKIQEAKRQMEEAKREIPENCAEQRTVLKRLLEVAASLLLAKNQLTKAKEELGRSQRLEKEAKAEYENARREAGFTSEADYLASVSVWKTKAQMEVEKKRNEQYFSALQEAKTTTEALGRQTEGTTYTELSELELELEKQRELKDLLLTNKEQAARILKNHERLLETLDIEEAEYTAMLDEFLLYDGLWQTASGKIKGRVRLDFETYVQRMYFEKILAAANKRFLVFTDGKMKLKSRPVDEMGLVGASGLEINVYVMATGKERDVKTLSGGESFLASLALALGLSDVVQSQAGSVRLESMFVDEGFGALDDGTREQAMRVLNDLAGDDRLVGIISHVNALKDSIDRKLVVKRGLQGSTISWN